MKLEKILEGIKYTVIEGSIEGNVKDIKYDSRKVEENDMYVAITGFNADGHDYIPEAISLGAKVIVVAKVMKIYGDVTIIKVNDTREFLAQAALNYFSHPEKKLTLIGVTGTAGKTTTTHLIKNILDNASIKTGLIGSIGIKYLDKIVTTKNTTPESYEVIKYLKEMLNLGITHVIIEASSQAYKLNRLFGLTFQIGVLTNITSDHIGVNEHKDHQEYVRCKNKLFLNSKEVIVNNDSLYLKEVLEGVTAPISSYSIKSESHLKVKEFELLNDNDVFGSRFVTEGLVNLEFKMNLPGKFNIYNALGAIMVALKLGIEPDIIKLSLLNVKVRGRMELALVMPTYKVLIDYAHTEDGLKNLVATLSEYHPKRLIAVFGGGGNRPKERRISLGEVIGTYSDICIITMDNPRFEEISAINEDIKLGLNKVNAKYIEIDDREKAIRYACNYAKEGDLIVLIGKGHEDYQDIKGVKYSFKELEILNKIKMGN